MGSHSAQTGPLSAAFTVRSVLWPKRDMGSNNPIDFCLETRAAKHRTKTTPRITLPMTSTCDHTVNTPYTYCIHTVYILYTQFKQTVYILSHIHTANKPETLCAHCKCGNHVNILYTHFKHTIYILSHAHAVNKHCHIFTL